MNSVWCTIRDQVQQSLSARTIRWKDGRCSSAEPGGCQSAVSSCSVVSFWILQTFSGPLWRCCVPHAALSLRVKILLRCSVLIFLMLLPPPSSHLLSIHNTEGAEIVLSAKHPVWRSRTSGEKRRYRSHCHNIWECVIPPALRVKMTCLNKTWRLESWSV